MLGRHLDPVLGDVHQEQGKVVKLTRLPLAVARVEEAQGGLRGLDAHEVAEAVDGRGIAAALDQGGCQLQHILSTIPDRHGANRLPRPLGEEVIAGLTEEIIADDVGEVGLDILLEGVGELGQRERVVPAIIGDTQPHLRPATKQVCRLVPSATSFPMNLLLSSHEFILRKRLAELGHDGVVDHLGRNGMIGAVPGETGKVRALVPIVEASE